MTTLRLAVIVALLPVAALAQGRGRGAPGPPLSGRAAAPYDLSGYWVALVTDDWRYRMLTKGQTLEQQLFAVTAKQA